MDANYNAVYDQERGLDHNESRSLTLPPAAKDDDTGAKSHETFQGVDDAVVDYENLV